MGDGSDIHGMSGRCKTCKHWWQWDPEMELDIGSCQRITMKPEPPMLAYCDDGSIVTHSEFGCVQWEAALPKDQSFDIDLSKPQSLYILLDMPNGTTVNLPCKLITMTSNERNGRYDVRIAAASTDELMRWVRDSVPEENVE